MLKQLGSTFFILSASAAFAVQLNRAETMFCRGLLRLSNFDYARASADFTEAIRANPRYAEAYFYRGNVFSSRALSSVRTNPEPYRRDYQSAIANYNEVLRLGYQRRDLVYFNRGNARAELGDYRGAIADLNEAIRLDPFPDPIAYERRALAYLYLGNKRAAANDLNQAANLYSRTGRDNEDYLSRLDLAEGVLAGKVTPRQINFSWTATTDYSDRQTKCP